MSYPKIIKPYLRYVLPILILVVLITGYAPIVQSWFVA